MKLIAHCIFFICFFSAPNTLFGQSDDRPLFSFGFIADVQYADRDNHNTRSYRSSLPKLVEAVTVFNEERVDFVVSAGDFINDTFENFDTLNAITRNLDMPLYHVLGNHEFVVDDDKKHLVLDKLKLKHPYYAFDKRNWRFIVLNGNDYSLISNIKGSEKYKKSEAIMEAVKTSGTGKASIYTGAIGEVQLEWLKRELSDADKKKKQVIILCHFPLYPEGSAKTLWNSSEVSEIIESSSSVRAYLNGHVHVSEYFFRNNVHYVSFKGMVENDGNAFAIISVYDDNIQIKGYGKEIHRVIKWNQR